ncbi:MAG: hypothetical protein ACYC6Z_08095 [Thermoleophilia bacterium]
MASTARAAISDSTITRFVTGSLSAGFRTDFLADCFLPAVLFITTDYSDNRRRYAKPATSLPPITRNLNRFRGIIRMMSQNAADGVTGLPEKKHESKKEKKYPTASAGRSHERGTGYGKGRRVGV